MQRGYAKKNGGEPVNDKLKAAREARGWTMIQAATYLQLRDDATYRNWEHGRATPTVKNLNKLCALFHKTSEELGFE